MLDLPLHFTPTCLPSTILGPGLNLGFCYISTSAQSSYLLTRWPPSTRRVVPPRWDGGPRRAPKCYAPSPYLQTNRESEQVHCGNAKERREFFISSALGLKPHLTQRNQTRAPNEAVWRFIYGQLFVSVTGCLAIPDWTGRMSSCNAFLMLSHIEIFPYLVKECSRKQEA